MIEASAIILGAIIGAIIGYRGMIQSAKIANQNNNHPLLNSVVKISLQAFNRLYNLVHSVFSKTTADRFLILGAHNGTAQMRFASAYYEQHKDRYDIEVSDVMLSFGAVSKFVKFEFDEHYRKMLKEVEVEGVVELIVKEMADCDLKNIYISENIHHSKVYFLDRIKDYDGKKNDLILYASLAKHGKDRFLPYEKVIMKSYVGQIKTLIQSISIEV
jgi:hypothetical protein